MIKIKRSHIVSVSSKNFDTPYLKMIGNVIINFQLNKYKIDQIFCSGCYYNIHNNINIQLYKVLTHSLFSLCIVHQSSYIQNTCLHKIYKVFIKHCDFSLKCCDFSELCQFCCSAGVLPAISGPSMKCTHQGKTERGKSTECI